MTDTSCDRGKFSSNNNPPRAAGRRSGCARYPVLGQNGGDAYSPYPLSDIQESFLVGRQIDPSDRAGSHIYIELYEGRLDVGKLEHAWNRLVQHHEMLRTQINRDSTQQLIEGGAEYQIKAHDFRSYDKHAIDQAIDDTRGQMSHKNYNAFECPLFEIRVSLISEEACVIHFSIDELIVDGASLHILLDQWFKLYEDTSFTLEPLSVSFRDYQLAVRAFQASEKYESDLAYWVHKLAGASLDFGHVQISKGMRERIGEAVVRKRLQYTLPAGEWHALKEQAKALNVYSTTMLMTIFSDVIASVYNRESLPVTLTYFNRPPIHPQLNKVVGPFISTSVFLVDSDHDRSLATRLHSNQRQLWEDLDHASVSGVRAIREVNRHQKSLINIPIVFTSFLALLGKEMPRWLNASNYMITQTPQVSLDHQVFEREDALYISWDVIEHDFGENVIKDMFDRFCALLTHVARNIDKWGSQDLYREVLTAPVLDVVADSDRAAAQLETECRTDALYAKYEAAGEFGLTEQQRAYLFSRVAAGEAGACQVYQEFVCRRVDINRLESVIRQLIHSHPMLKAVVGHDGKQEILTQVPDYKIEVFDHTPLSDEERQSAVTDTSDHLRDSVFKLGQWPFFNVCVSHTGQDESIIHCKVDMLIADGDSIHYFFSQMRTLYLQPHRSVTAPEISFKQYVGALSEFRALSDQSAASDYWKNKFANFPSGPSLAPLRAEAKKQGDGGHLRLMREIDEWPAVKARASEHGVSMDAVLVSAYARVLLEYDAAAALSVVVPLWQRRKLHDDVDDLIGDFTALSWVSATKDNGSILDSIKSVDTVLKNDLRYSVVDTLEALRSSLCQSGAIMPEFPVVFTGLMPRAEYPVDQTFVNGYGETRTPGVFLDCISVEVGSIGQIAWDIDSGILCPEKTGRVLDHYLELLRFLAKKDATWETMAYGDTWISGLGVNDTPPAAPRADAAADAGGCIHHYFERQAVLRPDATALVFEDSSLTYRELDRAANRYANHLRAQGVGRNKVVGVLAQRSLQMVVGLLAVIKAGGAYLPIDPGYPKDRILYLLEDAGVDVLLLDTQFYPAVEEYSGVKINLSSESEAIAASSPRRPATEIGQDDLCYVIYTSGSTGKPKGCMVPHKAILNRLLWMQDAYRISSDDRVLQKTPFSFDVSVWEFFWPLMAGATLVIAEPERHKDSRYLVDYIQARQITVCHFVPSMLSFFLTESGVERCRSLRHVFVSGEALPYPLMQKFQATLPAHLHNLYGPTEAAVDVTYWECVDRSDKKVPIGRPIRNIQIHILDERLNPVPQGDAGEIHIGGIGLARGYLNRPSLTAEKFVPSPFVAGEKLYKTGDVGRWLSDGNIEYLGRMDSQIKLRGFRIELGEIETALVRHPAVDSVAVLVQDADTVDPKLVAYYTPVPGVSATAKTLRAYLKQSLPEHFVPNLFVALNEIPVTAHGKLDRKRLPWPVGGLDVCTGIQRPGPTEQPALEGEAGSAMSASDADRSDPASRTIEDIRKHLADIVKPLLHVGAIEPDRDLFECGATSLTIINISQAVEREFAIALSASEFVEGVLREPTIDWMAGFIARAQPQAGTGVASMYRAGEYDDAQALTQSVCALFQERLNTTALAPDSDVFDYGATSLSMVNICQALETQYGVSISVSDLMEGFLEHPTVNWMAAYLRERMPTQGTVPGHDVAQPAVESDNTRREELDGERHCIELEKLSVAPKHYVTGHTSEDHAMRVSSNALSSLLSLLSAQTLAGYPDARYLFPTVGGKKSVQGYVAISAGSETGLHEGVYYYHPEKHALFPISEEPVDDLLAPTPDHATADVYVIFVAQLAALTPIYQSHSGYLSAVEAGYMMQLLVGNGHSHGVMLDLVTDFDPKKLHTRLKLDDSHRVIGTLAGGRRAGRICADRNTRDRSLLRNVFAGELACTDAALITLHEYRAASHLSTLKPLPQSDLEALEREQRHLRHDIDECRAIELDKQRLPDDRYRVRASQRQYLAESVPRACLGRLLSLLRPRVSRGGDAVYLYPSVGGLYGIDTYVYVKDNGVASVKPGLYRYFRETHALRFVKALPSKAIESSHVPFNRRHFKQSAFSIFFIAKASRLRPVLGEAFVHYALQEAGSMGQLLLEHQAEFGLGFCPVGGVNFDRIRADFDLDPDDCLLHQLVGGPVVWENVDAAINALDPEGADEDAAGPSRAEASDREDRRLGDLAIIGISGRYPGAEGLEALWENLKAGTRSIGAIPVDRWDGILHDLPQTSRDALPGAGAFLDDIESFDSLLFNISPLEAQAMDPQERLFMEIVWECIENAGYRAGALAGAAGKVGVFVGAMWSDYQSLGTDHWRFDGSEYATSLHSDIANRISYFFDFHGPSLSVGTSCASALTSIHLACESLKRGECRVALAGGVNLVSHPYHLAALNRYGLLSSDKKSSAFSAQASGWVVGEGVGAVLIKPLDAAVADGDHIYCVIKATALEHAGRSSQYGAANSKAQTQSIMHVLRKSGVAARDISYVETAAAGAGLADASEIAALSQSLGLNAREAPCALGSIKPNIGHLESASGMSQLAKVILQLEHRQLAPSIDSDPPNPLIQLDGTRLEINRALRDWDAFAREGERRGPLTALVNGFGASGSCGHLLIQEYVRPAMDGKPADGPEVVVLSAATQRQLGEYATRLLRFVESCEAARYALRDIAGTLQEGREAMEERLAIVADGLDDLQMSLIRYLSAGYDPAQRIFAGRAARLDESLVVADGTLLTDAARHWVAGGGVQWRHNGAAPYRKVPLPAYPFARQRHWIGHAAPCGKGAAERREETNQAQLRRKTENYLREVFSQGSGMPAESLRRDVTFEKYGINSAMIQRMNATLAETFGDIPKSVFFEFQTLSQLTDYFLDKHGDKLVDSFKLTDAPQAAELRQDECLARAGTSEASRVGHQPPLGLVGQVKSDDIAVIGLAGRFPQAENIEVFWENMKNGRNCITGLPEDRAYNAEQLQQLGISAWGGYIDGVDRFDPLFFGISPSWAELMDPQERLLLETAWHAMENAGYSRIALHDELQARIGVFVGVMYSDYQMLGPIEDRNHGRRACSPGYGSIANRVSYHLGLRGPSMAIDTMCSSSLTALHLAVESIKRNECAAAIVGGVNVLVHPNRYILHAQFNMTSQSGLCHSFGADGDGFVPGEGVCAILIKPLAQAEADGDPIYGVIKSSAINHDGKSGGYTVPNPLAQREVIKAALTKAGLDPRTISYVEAHGTGTVLGDPIEVEGLIDAFGAYAHDRPFCALGSVKSNIGHLEGAAGLAALAKVLLQMRHKKLVPSLHSKTLNPNINLNASPFYIPQTYCDWTQPVLEIDGKATPIPRRAGISSFGAGGANAHLIVEEYDRCPADESTPRSTRRGPRLVVLSAMSDEALNAYGQRLLRFLTEGGPVPDAASECEAHPVSLDQIEYTLLCGRDALNERLAFLVNDRDELVARLSAFCSDGSLGANAYRGSAENLAQATLGVDLDDDLVTELSHILLARGDIERLARLWVNGASVDWMALFPDARLQKVSLPAYPFARERHWIGSGGSKRPEHDLGTGHPFVDRNVSTFDEIKFATRFTGREHYLEDHRIHGRQTLPGVVQIEMARAVCEQAAERSVVSIRDVVWLNPVLVADGILDVTVTVQRTGGSIDYQVVTTAEDGDVRTHSRGTCDLEGTPTGSADDQLDIAALRARCTDRQSADIFYRTAERLGLAYGPIFRSISELRVGENEALADIVVANEHFAEFAPLPLHPLVLDAALQSVYALGVDGREEAVAYIPFGIDRIDVLRPLPATCVAYVSRRSASNDDASAQKYDLVLIDGTGNRLVNIKGFLLRRIDRAWVPGKIAAASAQTLYYRPTWKRADLADQPVGLRTHSTGPVVVFTANTAWATALRERLAAQQLVVVRLGMAFEQTGPLDYVIAPKSEADYAALLSALRNKGVRWDEIVYHAAEPAHDVLIDDMPLYPVMFLSRQLIEHGLEGNVHLTYVHDGDEPRHTAVGGFAESLYKEEPRLIIRTVGFRSDADVRMQARAVADELGHRGNGVQHVLYDDGRYMRVVDRLVTDQGGDRRATIRHQGVYLITGGLGGIGTLLARHLSRMYQAKLVLVGRSPLNTAKRETLRAVNDLGGEAEYMHADISRHDDCVRVADYTKKRFGRIDGIVHCAGVNRDSLVLTKATGAIDDVLGAKVLGALNLDEAVRAERLDFFTLFSSLVGVIGNVGQADYAYANAFLDAFAERRERLRQAGQRTGVTRSIAWPYWEAGGMVLDEQVAAALRSSFDLVPLGEKAGLRAFEYAISAENDRIIVVESVGDRTDRLFVTSDSEQAPQVKSEPVQYDEDTVARVRAGIEDYLRELVSVETKLPKERIDTRVAMDRYGIDSVMVVNITKGLERLLGNVSKTLLFEYQTLDKLCNYLLSHYGLRLAALFAKQEAVSETKGTEQTPAGGAVASPASVPKAVEPRNDTGPAADIAIIGLSGRYPMADTLDAFWDNLKAGKDCITEIPRSRWDFREDFDADPKTRGKSYTKWGGFISNVDMFDPMFFKMTPTDARFTDPQQRLFLETVYSAIADAGYTPDNLGGAVESRDIGVFVGTMWADYRLLEGDAEENIRIPQASHWAIPNRISYFFDFHGPSIAVDTACSSSLTAIHMAIDSMRAGTCRIAIAGGINLSIHPIKYRVLSQDKFASLDGKCRSFGDGGTGYVPGEGVGAVVLKPLSAARRDGDHIYGVIKASVLNHGGKTNGFTVPNPNAQADLVRNALQQSGIDPRQIGYIEAHGTGTSLGDPIEIVGLTRAYNEKDSHAKQYCPIGSVKSNIGHLEGAAGIAGLTKVLLQMKHGQLVPSIHNEPVNPKINFDDSPFYVQRRLEDWARMTVDVRGVAVEQPRRAAISSFGAGGANAHLIVEEYLEPALRGKTNSDAPIPRLFLLSAKEKLQLLESAGNLCRFLEAHEDLDLNDVAYTLQVGRSSFGCRLAIIASRRDQVLDILREYAAHSEGNNAIYCHGENGIETIEPSVMPQTDETSRLIESSFLNKDYKHVAALWGAGATIDWENLYVLLNTRRQRVSLPTYPFAKERCWVFERPTQVAEIRYLTPREN